MNQLAKPTWTDLEPAALCDHISNHHHELLKSLFPEIIIHARVASKVDIGYIAGIGTLESLTLELISIAKQYLLFETNLLLPFLAHKVKYPENEISRLGNTELALFLKNTTNRQEQLLKRLDSLREATGKYAAPVNASPSAKHFFAAMGELDATLREMILIETNTLFLKGGLTGFPTDDKQIRRQPSKPLTPVSMLPILVCTDFSLGSNNAVRYAAEMAKTFQTELIILHVSHSSVAATDNTSLLPADEKERKAEALKRLETTALQMKEITGVEAQTSCSVGLPVEEITMAARRLKAGMIITGSRETAAGSGMVGGLVYDLMHSADIPVMAIPIGITFTAMKRIVLASDLRKGEAFDDTTLRNIINRFNGELFLVSVLNPGEKPGVDKAIAGYELEHRYSDISHHLELTEGDNLVDSLNEFAFEKKADLIVMVPHQHNFLVRMMRATQTQKVLKGTHRPLLTLAGSNKSN